MPQCYLSPTHFIREQYEPCFCLPNRSWFSFYRPRRDRRLSQASWLVTYLDGLPVQRRLPIQVLTGADVDLLPGSDQRYWPLHHAANLYVVSYVLWPWTLVIITNGFICIAARMLDYTHTISATQDSTYNRIHTHTSATYTQFSTVMQAAIHGIQPYRGR